MRDDESRMHRAGPSASVQVMQTPSDNVVIGDHFIGAVAEVWHLSDIRPSLWHAHSTRRRRRSVQVSLHGTELKSRLKVVASPNLVVVINVGPDIAERERH